MRRDWIFRNETSKVIGPQVASRFIDMEAIGYAVPVEGERLLVDNNCCIMVSTCKIDIPSR